jgi:diguanylate cyclase (GGDEF)-like protein
MSESDSIIVPLSISAFTWEQIAAAINNSVPAPRAAALLDEVRDALDLDSGPAWEDLATEKALLQQEMEMAASVDQLTGLRNRQRFFEDLRREFSSARRYDTPLSILLLDVDGLARVNDDQGFDAGDRLLLIISELLLTRLRVSDIAARIGDDDFAVILPHTPLDGARVLAARVIETLGDWVHAGVASAELETTSGSEMLQSAAHDLDRVRGRA